MSREIDQDTGLDTTYKQPNESRLYTFDFSNILGTDTVSSVVSITAENLGRIDSSSDITLTEKAHNSDVIVQVRIADGQHGENYKVIALITTSNSNTLEGEGLLKVRNL